MKPLFKALIMLVLSAALFSSCKKDNAPTQGQVMVSRIISETGSNDVANVYIWDYSTGSLRDSAPAATLNGDGTITLRTGSSTNVYSLERLIRYTVNGSGGLSLYF